MPRDSAGDRALIEKWVETWRRAGPELERIRRMELEALDTREAIRQIFGGVDFKTLPPAPPTSGLIQQQAWFRRIHGMHREP